MGARLTRQGSWTPLVVVFLTLCCLFTPAATVKHELFKTCSQAGFCARNRAYADSAVTKEAGWTSPYSLDPATIKFQNGALTGTIIKYLDHPLGKTVNLPLTITFLESGVARVTVDEEKRQKGEIELRHGSSVRKERYNEAEKWVIVGGLNVSKTVKLNQMGEDGVTRVKFGRSGAHEAVIKHSPFSIDFKRDGETQVRFNEGGLLNVEHWRAKVETPERKEGEEEGVIAGEPGIDDSTWWDESFGGNTDTKPRGPESVGMDVTFPGYEHVFGIPEHSGPLSLKETRGGEGNFEEPYRLYNADVFEYIMDSPMTLYGAIPLMQAHKKNSTVGVFWLNAAETWVDIVKRKAPSNPLSLGIGAPTDTHTHWFSESGLLDVFVLLGPTPKEISKTYGALTGYTQLPQQFAIAYHQCRWNYVTDEDVKDVDRKMDKFNIPYDIIWLDIEYTDGKKYFTWDPLTFDDPEGMLKQLDEHERKLVAIIDPHIKKEDGYPIVKELLDQKLATKNKEGEQYEGWCWPGASYWIDAFNPAARSWWKGLFGYEKFKGTAANVFIWNDMNEPSVFNGPETTMPKDNVHHGGWEHRDVHNLNGMTFNNATYEALLARDGPSNPKRPFVLTRAFFSGSQRIGAVWTGDNQAEWSHLAASLPMTMSLGISGYPFAGADVGGFFGNPSKELLTRWYQAGAFYPFFRGHAHIDTRRREPYLAGEPYTGIITQALRLRYSLLPAWYTAFRAASVDGLPIVRPNWYVHPDDSAGFEIEDQMTLADTGLLVKPVTAESQESVDIYLADAVPYYDYFDYTVHSGAAGRKATVPAPLDKIPLLMRAGHIIPRRDRPRRSSGPMRWDPFTLVVVLDGSETGGQAQGELYVDDGESYAFEQGAYIHRNFRYSAAEGVLMSEDLNSMHAGKDATTYVKTMEKVVVEKIIIVGAPASWKGKSKASVREEGGRQVEAEMVFQEARDGKAAWAVVKRPAVGIGRNWQVAF